MSDKLTEFVIYHNKWQQAQIEVAQQEYQRLFFSHIDMLSRELEQKVLLVNDLSKLNNKKIVTLIDELLEIQSLRYEDAVTQYIKLSGSLADYVSVTEANIFNLKPVANTVNYALKNPMPASGMMLPDHMNNLVAYNNKKLSDTVRYSWANKEDAQELAKKITGTKARRYKDGLINDQKVKSRAALDTATQHVVSGAKGETLKSNKVYKYRLRATLDYSTTPLCQSLDGKIYEWGSADARVPPFHYYCRTVIVPYDELVDSLLEGSTRASVTGPVDRNITYKEWIKHNPRPKDWTEPARYDRRRKKEDKDEKSTKKTAKKSTKKKAKKDE